MVNIGCFQKTLHFEFPKAECTGTDTEYCGIHIGTKGKNFYFVHLWNTARNLVDFLESDLLNPSETVVENMEIFKSNTKYHTPKNGEVRSII